MPQDEDQNGHGSHVAGTIGGRTFGVAKAANIVGVKVLDGTGAGSNAGVLDGMQFGESIPNPDASRPYLINRQSSTMSSRRVSLARLL